MTEAERKETLRATAEENGLPVKLVEKWDLVFGTICRQLELNFDLSIKVESSMICHKQYDIFVEIEDKSRLYVVVRVGEKLILKVFVKNSTPQHLQDLIYMVSRAIDARLKPGVKMMINK